MLLDDDVPASFQVAWINDNVLGLATIQTHFEPPFSAEVHPLGAIQSIDLVASPVAAGVAGLVDLRVARSMTVRFTAGESMTIGRLVDDQFAERFIEEVLAAVNAEGV
ncbi:hypothetical protein [Mycobacteroides abscessus]|uniref:hypothetical protein n=1 Tax=Mycobacteroides abscessus TaxID=36809 RepID=UPI00092860B2|nr:hypothetical protein [Mycobacteroides abscessus]SHT05686.1 Uncharacterised protein [Mycobacteroides abscessus subsp. abscessus]SHX46368.1 Uncharacterised protein [Mycobacteroides abscessus subsp. abscessus]SKG05872.1 Uncharacterised protein [Mycobacteroides abscessus subsp. abscessus]SKG20288.1 Uncharacterised protein [Mycobacteroides abscessus subsp. abscessus]SKG79175.1 Uncharacterised protein [Mycobacteroides abscessus subsp. abscessus]